MWLGQTNKKVIYQFHALDEMDIKGLYEIEVEKTLHTTSLKIKADERSTLIIVWLKHWANAGDIIDKLIDLTGAYRTDKLTSIKKYIEIVNSYKTKELICHNHIQE